MLNDSTSPIAGLYDTHSRLKPARCTSIHPPPTTRNSRHNTCKRTCRHTQRTRIMRCTDFVFNRQNLTMTSVRGEGIKDLIFFHLGAGVNDPIAVGWCRKGNVAIDKRCSSSQSRVKFIAKFIAERTWQPTLHNFT